MANAPPGTRAIPAVVAPTRTCRQRARSRSALRHPIRVTRRFAVRPTTRALHLSRWMTDRWARWLLHDRHGGAAVGRERLLAQLAPIWDRVLCSTGPS